MNSDRHPDEWDEEPPIEISEEEIEDWEDQDYGGDEPLVLDEDYDFDDYDYVDMYDPGDYDPAAEAER